MKKTEKKPAKKKTVEYIHGSRRTITKKPKTLTFEGNNALKPLANQPFKGQYIKESFPLPKERTFEEWILDLETINERNMKETHCVQVTVIQWNELRQIIRRLKEVTFEELLKQMPGGSFGTFKDESEDESNGELHHIKRMIRDGKEL